MPDAEIRHHTWDTVRALLRRCEAELRPEHYEALLVLYEDLRADGASPDTVYAYLCRASLFMKFLEERGARLEEATARTIKAFLARYFSASTKYAVLNAIRRLARALGSEPLLKAAYEVKTKRRTGDLPEVADPRAVQLLITNARQPYRTILVLLYEGGLRRCEALSLKYGDVEPWDYGYKIYVRKSKSQGRVVFIIRYQQVLREWLEAHRSKDPADWLFYTSTGNPVKPSTLTTYVRRLARRLGLNPDALNLHPHAFRHLRATELYKSRKLTEKEMMKLFGWRSRRMIDIYARITQDDVEESLRRIYGLPEPAAPNEQEIRCPRCGALAPREARYCPLCGQPLAEEIVAEKIRRVEEARRVLDAIKVLLREHPELLAELLRA